MKSTRFFYAVVFTFLFLVVSCGENNFRSEKRKVETDRLDGDKTDGNPEQGAVTSPTALNVVESFQKSGPKVIGSDIVFIVDTSSSMRGEKAAVQNNMNAFLAQFKAEQGFKVYVVGTKFSINAAGSATPLELVNDFVGSNSALHNLIKLIDEKKFRPNIPLDVVVVTDDNSAYTPEGFKAEIAKRQGAVGQIRMHSIVGLKRGGGIAAVGSTYLTLSDDPQFLGSKHDLKSKDWSQLLTTLAAKIQQASVDNSLKLAQVPDLSKDFTLTVNGVEQPKEAYRVKPDGLVEFLVPDLQNASGSLEFKYFKVVSTT